MSVFNHHVSYQDLFHEHTPPSTTLAIPDPVLRTRAGLPKSKYSLDDKLRCLDPSSGLKETWARVQAFLTSVCFLDDQRNRHQAKQRPKCLDRVPWRALGEDEIIDHLLANRIPGRPPIWYGSRSTETSRYFCLDVDADDTAEKLLAKKYDLEAMPADMQAAELRKFRATLTLAPDTSRPSPTAVNPWNGHSAGWASTPRIPAAS